MTLTGPMSFSRWGIPELGDMRNDLGTRRCMKPSPLLPIAVTRISVTPLLSQSLSEFNATRKVLVLRPPQKTLVGRDDDQPHTLDIVLLDEERMLVVGDVGSRQIRGETADLLGIGTGSPHAVLSLTHLGRSDHLHGLGDFFSVLDTLDLVTDLFAASHIALRMPALCPALS